jgi:hypothetical protein
MGKNRLNEVHQFAFLIGKYTVPIFIDDKHSDYNFYLVLTLILEILVLNYNPLEVIERSEHAVTKFIAQTLLLSKT